MRDRTGQLSVRIEVSAEPGVKLPEYATEHSAGMDLRAHVAEPVTLAPGERTLIPTGIRLAIPPGYEGQVRPRSGLAIRHGLSLLNSPGTIDADYRGEIKVIIANLGTEPVTINPGDRIAQLVIAPIARAELVQVERLPETERGEAGFGHTGVQ